jgi:adenylate cyclase
MSSDSRKFATGVLERYRGFQRAAESVNLTERKAAGLRASAHPANGHPDFTDLDLGQSGHCNAVAVFFDLAKFTWRTFWEPPEKVRMLAQAVLGQLSLVVQDNGGYVIGLRGDGLFACFGGEGSDPRVDMGAALGAAAFAMDATRNALNQLLEISGIEPVQLRVGADYGRLDFTRTGTPGGSEVNVVSFGIVIK